MDQNLFDPHRNPENQATLASNFRKSAGYSTGAQPGAVNEHAGIRRLSAQ